MSETAAHNPTLYVATPSTEDVVTTKLMVPRDLPSLRVRHLSPEVSEGAHCASGLWHKKVGKRIKLLG